MDINNVISGILSVGGNISLVLEFMGFLSFVALAIGAFTRLGKAAWRFGLALYGKKILIVASDEDYHDLEEDLSDSGLIKRKNIQRVSDKQISKAKDALLLIVVYGYLDKEGFRRLSTVRAPDADLSFTVRRKRAESTMTRRSSLVKPHLPRFAIYEAG